MNHLVAQYLAGVVTANASFDKLTMPWFWSLASCALVIPCSRALALKAASEFRVVAMTPKSMQEKLNN